MFRHGLLSLSYLAFFYCLNILDPSVLNLSIIISLLIFVIYNISSGRVFLGDFGAYFLSALVAFLCLDAYQNNEISIFFIAIIGFCLLIVSYSRSNNLEQQKGNMSP